MNTAYMNKEELKEYNLKKIGFSKNQLIKQINRDCKTVVVFCETLQSYIPVTKTAAIKAINDTSYPTDSCRLVGERFIIG
jgi:hypothetical protein